ncbi:MAG: adenylate/guanylate cyclase domain-containing protein [Spirochaetales bacterium]|nr:adenylate/guanylate cyclase domain-containing protein [Spirochaetales bacterium]
MNPFKADLKKVYYFSIAIFLLLAIVLYGLFFVNIGNTFKIKYLPQTKTDAVQVSRSGILEDINGLTWMYFFISMGLFFLSFIFSFVTYWLFFKRPFNELVKGIRAVSDGDYETRLAVKGLREIADLFEDFNNMVRSCQKKIAIKHYVSGSTEKMIEQLETGEITTQPHRKLITIFFSDVREFTSFSEQNDPLVVINTINEIFSIQVAAIKKYKGDIDKFIGDEIMVEFPTPAQAFKAAMEIQRKLVTFNSKRENPLEVGIGINFGEAIVGAIGSGIQFDWTMIGHTVNVARRLCAAAEKGEVVVSHSLYEKLNVKRECEQKDIRVKGVSKPVKAYFFCK